MLGYPLVAATNRTGGGGPKTKTRHKWLQTSWFGVLGELQLEAQPGSVQDVPLSKIGNARLRMSGGAVSQDEILRRNLGSGVWVH